MPSSDLPLSHRLYQRITGEDWYQGQAKLARAFHQSVPLGIQEAITRNHTRRDDVLRFAHWMHVHEPQWQLSVLDIGARRGLRALHPWGKLYHLADNNQLAVTGIEPEPTEHALLVASGDYAAVHNVAVHDYSGQSKLFITRSPGCSSVYPPAEHMQHYSAGEQFLVDEEITVDVVPLDTLFPDQQFDIIKIDVQGAEYNVLQGGIHLAEQAFGIALEGQLSPLYDGQALLGDLLQWFAAKDWKCISMDHSGSFCDGEIMETDIAFVPNPDSIRDRQSLYKVIAFCLASENKAYVELLLRWREDLLPAPVRQQLMAALHITPQPKITPPKGRY